MCLSCGCVPAQHGTPVDDHGDARHITMLVLQGAADAAGIEAGAAARNVLASLGIGESDDDYWPPVAKVADAVPGALLKAQEERRYTLMLALPALKPDVAKAADGRRDYIRPEVVEKTAWDWMAKSRSIGLFHQDGTSGCGTVVESYLHRSGDWLVKATDGTEVLIKDGDWLVGVVWQPEAWALVKRGLINGMSAQGSARRAPADPSLTFDRT